MNEPEKILDAITKPYTKKIYQVYWSKTIGIGSISFCKHNKKWSLRITLSKGW